MTTSGWAIKVSYADPDGTPHSRLLGNYYFLHICTVPGGPFGGYETAVFRTRQLARDAARQAGRGYDHATAVRVDVSVVERLWLERDSDFDD